MNTKTRPLPVSHPNAGGTAVSVVIATYNRIDSLLWLLDDLSAQAGVRGGFEVVVVDDGSAVAVEPEVLARRSAFPVTVMRRPNAGPSVARDMGIRASTGDVIVIVDDDMVIPADFLAAHQRGHDAGAEVVLGLIRAPRFGKPLPLFERFHQDSLDRFVSAYRAGDVVVAGTRLCTGNVSFLRRAYLAVGGFDLTLLRCEDRDLGIRFEEAGYRFAFTEDGWSDHRSDHDSVPTWRRRSALYGELDLKISEKHPTRPGVSPWAFLGHLPKVAVPIVVTAAISPPLGRLFAAAGYRLGLWADGRRLAPLAITGASLCYGCDYFSGVGTALRRPRGTRGVLASLRRHLAGPVVA